MKPVVSRKTMKRILWWTQRGLFAFAVLTIGYCAFILADTWMFQNDRRHQLDRLFNTSRIASPASLTSSAPVLVDGMIGLIAIPRLGVSVIVMEGTTSRTLRRAAGHIPGTGMPGMPGNIGISAHRDTFFRPLRNIRQNDIVTLTTVRGEYRYRVVSTKVVDPQDVAVLAPSRNEILTLVTCYPFYYVGAAPDRFIVRAERVT